MLRANFVSMLAVTASDVIPKMANQTFSAMPMSTVRSNVSRMLMSSSTAPHSKIVDISHEQDLKRGLTTSGEKSQYEENNKTMAQKVVEKTEEMADKVNERVQKAADKMDNAAIRMTTGASQAQVDLAKDRMKQQKAPMDDKPIDWQHVQPGTQHLKGTNDNFNDDPAISIGEMEDKARNAKNAVEDSAKDVAHAVVPETILQSMEHTAKDVKNAVKDAVKATPLHDMGHAMKVKAKEMMTGEREKEKPDETKSEVRTKDWDKHQKRQQGGGR
jgi:hypothetical protein